MQVLQVVKLFLRKMPSCHESQCASRVTVGEARERGESAELVPLMSNITLQIYIDILNLQGYEFDLPESKH